jgi:hypothetical protein
MLLRRILMIPFLLVCGFVFSQHKYLKATKTVGAPRIDGDLSDAAWTNVPVATDFIQNFPNFGLAASFKTEVRIIYDNNAIYIGAYLYDDPSQLRKQITSRDGEQQTDVDYFSVFFDTYNDHQNGFQFLVTTMNVQTDARLGPNYTGRFNGFGDKTWDAVWDSQVEIKNDGWVVEMRIPYSSLRFAKRETQDWGLQLMRFTRRNNETSFWNPFDPNISGIANQFGELQELQNIKPPLRLSLSPYISAGIRSTPIKNEYSTEWLHNGGMDVKYGINESFTLDATLIPDFGQVVSDPLVNNLTPFEVRFQENRPFFTEGTELFNKSGLFYSRRIGARPPGYYSILDMVDSDPNLEIVKNPVVTQLYNAIKFSGRTKKKLGIGVFNAITAPMKATIRDKTTAEETKIETSPLTNFNLFVLDQALKGRSYLTITNANTLRNGNSRDANVSAFDFALYDKKNIHALTGTARYSKIFQQSGYDGFNTTLRYGKVSGKVQYQGSVNVESDDYGPNDLGYLVSPNEIAYRGFISYNQPSATAKFNSYSYRLELVYLRLYDPNAYSSVQVHTNSFWYFKNFWDVNLTVGLFPAWMRDYFELQTPGRFVRKPWYGYAGINGSSDSRKKLFVRFGATYAVGAKPDKDFKEKDYYDLTAGGRYRFSDRLSLDLEVRRTDDESQVGYAFLRETNGEPIIGFRRNEDFTTVLTGTFNFTPRANVSFRGRHYWNKVQYRRFYTVSPDGYYIPRTVATPNRDQNVNIFNLDVFFNWDFRLGSRLVLGWKNWLGEDELIDGSQYRKYLDNFGQLFSKRHGNELTVKFIYYLDYNQFRRK